MVLVFPKPGMLGMRQEYTSDISPLQEAILTNKHFAVGFQIETPEETLESLHKQ